jgi:phosphate/sulfate permease
MKGSTTFSLTPLIIGLGAALFALSSLGSDRLNAWQWSLAVAAALLAGLVVGTALNFAVFAPVYWLLRRLHSGRAQRETGHEQKT